MCVYVCVYMYVCLCVDGILESPIIQCESTSLKDETESEFEISSHEESYTNVKQENTRPLNKLVKDNQSSKDLTLEISLQDSQLEANYVRASGTEEKRYEEVVEPLPEHSGNDSAMQNKYHDYNIDQNPEFDDKTEKLTRSKDENATKKTKHRAKPRMEIRQVPKRGAAEAKLAKSRIITRKKTNSSSMLKYKYLKDDECKKSKLKEHNEDVFIDTPDCIEYEKFMKNDETIDIEKTDAFKTYTHPDENDSTSTKSYSDNDECNQQKVTSREVTIQREVKRSSNPKRGPKETKTAKYKLASHGRKIQRKVNFYSS